MVVGLVVFVGVTACTAAQPPQSPQGLATASGQPTAATSSPPTTTTSPRPVARVDAKRCPVTLPRKWTPPPGVPADALFGSGSSYGNGKLWVGGLGTGGILDVLPEFVDKDGSIGMKFGWWRAAPGKLRITGRRLDSPAPPAIGEVPDGYGDLGFQASGVRFPTEGCWEVTGSLPTTSVTFVTFVIKTSG
jgi:hypothetical protein